jgi:signal peptidase I
MAKVGLEDSIRRAFAEGAVLKKGVVLAEGYVDTGDLVLVDKISYHFRKPKRGEVFVFDTVGITGIRHVSGEQGGGFHYIKRLCGVPGDELTIVHPNLLNHGRILQEPGIQRVARKEPGYNGYHARNTAYLCELTKQSLVLRRDGARPGQREYAALGDNTNNSADSRYWGRVKEHNLVGPALFALWPFTSGHWGVIR